MRPRGTLSRAHFRALAVTSLAGATCLFSTFATAASASGKAPASCRAGCTSAVLSSHTTNPRSSPHMSLHVTPVSVVAGKSATITAKGFGAHESVAVWDYTGTHYRSSKELQGGSSSSRGTLSFKHKTNSSISAAERRQRICLQGKTSHRIVCGRYTVKLTSTETSPPEEAEAPEEGTPPHEVGTTPPDEGTEAEGKESPAEKKAEEKKAEEKKKQEEKEVAEEEAKEEGELKGVSGHVTAGARSAHESSFSARRDVASDVASFGAKKLHFKGQTSLETPFSAATTSTSVSLAVTLPPETICEGNVSYLIGRTIYQEGIPIEGGRFSYTFSGESSWNLYTGYYDSYTFALSGRVRGHLLTGILRNRDLIYGPTAGAVLGACSTVLTYRVKAR